MPVDEPEHTAPSDDTNVTNDGASATDPAEGSDDAAAKQPGSPAESADA